MKPRNSIEYPRVVYPQRGCAGESIQSENWSLNEINDLRETIDTTRAEQIALDDALVAPANQLKVGKSNFRLSSNLKSKEATLQVVYDVLKLTHFYNAFQISGDVLEIYMQEFWVTATVNHHSIRFKMNSKKHIVNS
ncbi:hypothetical protein Tco_0276694 [Tanacetum coccineum]